MSLFVVKGMRVDCAVLFSISKEFVVRKPLMLFLLVSNLGFAVATADVYPHVQDSSFGNAVRYLGVAHVPGVIVTLTCDSGMHNCVPSDTVLDSTVSMLNQEAIHLPANSANTQICADLTPTASWNYRNVSGGAQDSLAVNFGARMRVESVVLEDPKLIDQQTGQPFAGGFEVYEPLVDESANLDHGKQVSRYREFTRACVAPLISREVLAARGLKESQIDAFFQESLIIRMGIEGFISRADHAHLFYSVRLFAD